MIPILYEKDETAFNSNGLGRLRDCISCVVTEERNGIYECDFEYPIDGVNYDRIQCGRIIGVEHDESNDIQPFDIVSYSRPINGVVTFHCTHISYRQCALTVSGTNINSLADAFTMLGTADPTNPFTYWTDKTSTGFLASGDGVPHSVRSVLGGMEGSILDAYGGEYEWDKWTVKLWSSRGTLKPFTIRYGVNLTDYTEDVDYSDTYTSCIPYWSGQDDNGNDVIVKGSRQTVSYPSFNGVDRCIPLDVTDKFESKPTQAQVESAGLSYMNSNQTYMPSQNITVDFVRISDTPEYAQFKSLQTCKLCDSINVEFPLYNMTGQFKIVKTEYDVLQERFSKMELGTLATTLAEALGISQDSASRALSFNTILDDITDLKIVNDTYGQFVGLTAELSLTTSQQKVPFATFSGSNCSSSSNGIKVQNAGRYIVTASLYLSDGFSANDIVHAYIRKNSTSMREGIIRLNVANYYSILVLAPTIMDLSANDVVYVYAYNQGGARGKVTGGTERTILTLWRIK